VAILQGGAPGTTSPMPGYNTPVGTPHHTAKSPAQDSARTADYSRAHFETVFPKQQDSSGMLHHNLCLRFFRAVLSICLSLVSLLCSCDLLFVLQIAIVSDIYKKTNKCTLVLWT